MQAYTTEKRSGEICLGLKCEFASKECGGSRGVIIMINFTSLINCYILAVHGISSLKIKQKFFFRYLHLLTFLFAYRPTVSLQHRSGCALQFTDVTA